MAEDKRKIKQETLEKLRKTILAIFSNGEYHEAGIREICKRAKVSPQTIYKYFGNKEMLLISCMEGDLNRLFDHVLTALPEASNPLEKLQLFASTSAEFYAAEPEVSRIIFQNIPNIYWVKRRSSSLEKYQSLLMNLLVEAKKEGHFTKQQDLNLVFDIFSGAFNRMMLRWVSEDFSGDIVKQGKDLSTMIMEIAS